MSLLEVKSSTFSAEYYPEIFSCSISPRVRVRQTGEGTAELGMVWYGWMWQGMGLEGRGQCLDHETGHQAVHGKEQSAGTVENARPGPYGRTEV